MSCDFSSVPVILEQSLAGGELHRLLQTKQFKIRVSSSTPAYSCVFPLCSVIFTVETFANISTSGELDKEFIQRLDKSLTLHYRQYTVLIAPMLGSKEIHLLTTLQHRYLLSNLQFLPVHNISECLSSMLSIVKVTVRSVCEVVRERYEKVMEKTISEDTVMSVLEKTGLTSHEVAVTIDGRGSLQSLACSDVQSLIDHTSLEQHRAILLNQFLSNEN